MRAMKRYFLSLIPLLVCLVSAALYNWILSDEHVADVSAGLGGGWGRGELAFVCFWAGIVSSLFLISLFLVYDITKEVTKAWERRSIKKHTGTAVE